MDEDARERHRKLLELELPPPRFRRFRRRLSGVLLFLALFAVAVSIAWGLVR